MPDDRATVTNLSRACLAEAIGTFALVFAGTGAIIVNDLAGGQVTHVGIALVFGLVVMALIYTLGDVSGCHINPAATIGFWLARRFPGRRVGPYLLSQAAGAILASGLLRLMFAHSNLGATTPGGDVLQSFLLELVMTAGLIFVALHVSTGAQEKGIMAGAAIGAVVALEALFGGPISGASMNPARSLGPAVISGNLHALWIYLLAPCLGSLVAVWGCRGTRGDCCQGELCRK